MMKTSWKRLLLLTCCLLLTRWGEGQTCSLAEGSEEEDMNYTVVSRENFDTEMEQVRKDLAYYVSDELFRADDAQAVQVLYLTDGRCAVATNGTAQSVVVPIVGGQTYVIHCPVRSRKRVATFDHVPLALDDVPTVKINTTDTAEDLTITAGPDDVCLVFQPRIANDTAGIGEVLAATSITGPAGTTFGDLSASLRALDAKTDEKLQGVQGLTEAVEKLSQAVLTVHPQQADVVENHYVKAVSGVVSDETQPSYNYRYVTFGVVPGSVVSYTYTRDEKMAGLAFYRADGSCISGVLAVNGTQEIDVPAEAVTCRATIMTVDNVRVIDGIAPLLNDYAAFKQAASGQGGSGELLQTVLTISAKAEDVVENRYIRMNTGAESNETQPSWNYRYVTLGVIPGAKVRYTYTREESQAGLAFYRADGSYISGVLAFKGTQEVTVPDGAAVCKATVMKAEDASLAVSVGALVDDYAALKSQLGGGVSAPETDQADGLPEIIVPQRSIAVVGHEWNMYYDNVVYPMNDEYFVHVAVDGNGNGAGGMCALNDRVTITPDETFIGEHTVQIRLRRKADLATVKTKSFALVVIADTPVTGKKVVFIGDSLTDNDTYTAEIQHNLSRGGMESIGTKGGRATIDGQTYTVANEGRSGWATYDYTRTVDDYRGREDSDNPFWNPAEGRFDFGYYMSSQGYSHVDAVVIGLGTNGSNRPDKVVEAMSIMVQSVHAYDPQLPVIVSLIAQPSTQDGWGSIKDKPSTGAADIFRHDAHELNKRYMALFQDDEHYTDVAELYFALDTVHDYPAEEKPVSARNPATRTVQTNNVHPSVYGYLKFADVYYNRLLYWLTKE